MRYLKCSRKLLVAAFAFLFLPAAALAQQSASDALRPPSLRVGVGAALPVSGYLSTLHGPGPSVAAGLDVPISEAVDVTFGAGYTRLLLDDSRLTRIFGAAAGAAGAGNLTFDASGGAHHLTSGIAGLKWTFAMPGRAAFYLGGGTGLFYSSIDDLDIEARDAEGNDVAGDASLQSNAEGVWFGFDLGVGVRLPVASGVDVFVEPRYVLFWGAHYFDTRAGVSLNDVFGASPVGLEDAADQGAPAPRRYEVSAGYRGTFFGDGDETGAAYRLGVARRLFSDWTGLALAGAYRRAVDTDLQEDLRGWTKRRGVAADLAFFVDALQSETGAATHRLRIGAGPAVRRQWGEELRRSGDVPSGTTVRYDEERYDHFRSGSADGRTRYVLTNDFAETRFGGAFKLEYVLSFDRVTVGPSVGYWYYGEGQPATSYGVQVGVPFGAWLD